MSEGQRLRAALAAVLVGNPRVILLDEPTRGMDGFQKQQLASLLRALRARGACIVLSTHDVELAASLANRVVLLGQGEIVAGSRISCGCLSPGTCRCAWGAGGPARAWRDRAAAHTLTASSRN